jgi:hypothetical protein
MEAFASRDLDEIRSMRNCWAIARDGVATPLVSKNPAAELVDALRAGKIKSIGPDHRELPAAAWDTVLSHDFRTWPTVRFPREEMLKLFSDATVGGTNDEPIKPATRGRKPNIGRDHIKSVVFDLLEDNGDICDFDPEWRTQGDIEVETRTVLAGQKFSTERIPKRSQLRMYVSKFYREWKEKHDGQ